MRLHSDTITYRDIANAADAASTVEDGSVYVEMTMHGSRSRARAFEVGLSGDGTRNKRRRNPGAGDKDRSDLDYAATWDAWGRFFAYLYSVDSEMTCYAYADENDFHHKTQGQFL